MKLKLSLESHQVYQYSTHSEMLFRITDEENKITRDQFNRLRQLIKYWIDNENEEENDDNQTCIHGCEDCSCVDTGVCTC